MVQVGNRGDVGTMEIVEMLFSVRGGTAGAVLMEWNVAASSQGAAAMFDRHYAEAWATATLGQAFTNAVFAAMEAQLAADERSDNSGATISYTSGPTAGPT